MKVQAGVSRGGPWWLGPVALLAGIFVLHIFQQEPDARFPSGRFPAYCFCYILIIAGLAVCYGYAASRNWWHPDPLWNALLMALGMSVAAGIPAALIAGKGNASVLIRFGPLLYRTSDRGGRIAIFPVAAIFAAFALLAWVSFIRRLAARRTR